MKRRHTFQRLKVKDRKCRSLVEKLFYENCKQITSLPRNIREKSDPFGKTTFYCLKSEGSFLQDSNMVSSRINKIRSS